LAAPLRKTRFGVAMRLTSIQVENYRSIEKTQGISLDDGLTVILGPNNEGKSNLLRAIVLAMDALRHFRAAPARLQPIRDTRGFFLSETYIWERDYPQRLQQKHPEGKTILTLVFSLNEDERCSFKKSCGCSINSDLPLEISIGDRTLAFKVKKPGKGAKTYEAKGHNIASYVGNTFEFQYITAIRTGQQSIDVVSSLIERELGILEQNESYKAAVKTIEDLQKPVIARLEADVQSQLKKLLPSIKKIKIGSMQNRQRTINSNFRNRHRSAQLIIDDGSATDLESKGDGIKSLAAISLMRAAKTSSKTLVVAIEEPESHLHPGAVRQLAQIIQEMANEHQVIITTHSPLLIARNAVDANIIVSKSKARPATSIAEIRSSLGVHVSDNLAHAEHVILVEGETDAQILEALFRHRSNVFQTLIKEGKVAFEHMGGAANVPYKISNLKLSVINPILIIDDDKAGRQSAKTAKESGLILEKFVFTWRRPAKGNTEIEDLLVPEVYWGTMEEAFCVTLDRNLFDQSPDKWTDRIKNAYQAGGKAWSTSIESNIKKHVATCVARSPENATSSEMAKTVDNVINAIIQLIQPRKL
jgi:predicted ATPase